MAYQMASREDTVLKRLISFFKDIPCPTNGMDKLFLKGTVDFIPEMADACLHHIGMGVEAVIPDMFYDHSLGHYPPRISHEVLEEGKLKVLEIDSPVRRDTFLERRSMERSPTVNVVGSVMEVDRRKSAWMRVRSSDRANGLTM
jgi:hypothetical protein